MIATDTMLFLHLHKSGGTFVNALLMRCIPSARHIGYHLPYREAPPECRLLPVVGTVRSPWAYYVSWYHFQASRPKPNLLYRLCSDDGCLGFEDTVTNLLNLSTDEARLAEFEAGLPSQYSAAGLNLIKSSVGELRGLGAGFYSFLYQRLYAGADDPLILRAEQLRTELRAALESVGHWPNDCAERFLEDSPPLNVSSHDDPATYYGDRLAALVADRDRSVIDRFGYTL